MIAKADKSKAIVIIDRTVLRQKIGTFIQENNIMMVNKDPTEILSQTTTTDYAKM